MSATHELRAIQSMLSAGHRSVQLERHTLALWGLTGGFLVLVSDYVITVERFPGRSVRTLAVFVWLAFWMGVAAWADHRLTERARAKREETLPFVQTQLTRAWWTLLVVGVLGTVAMMVFGGSTMIYGFWMVIIGLALYLMGLFSRPVVEWVGLACMLLGVLSVASGWPIGASRWMAASFFLVGLPLAGAMNSLCQRTQYDQRLLGLLGLVVGWLGLVIAGPMLALSLQRDGYDAPVGQLIQLPAGTEVSLRIALRSDVIGVEASAALPIVLNQPLEFSDLDARLEGGSDGRYRLNNGPWRKVSDGLLNLRIDRFRIELIDGRPTLVAESRFENKDLTVENADPQTRSAR